MNTHERKSDGARTASPAGLNRRQGTQDAQNRSTPPTALPLLLDSPRPSDGRGIKGEGWAGGEESLGKRWALGLLSLFVCFAHFVVPSASAAVFTTNTLISEANTAYDGQDIVIDGSVTVTIDGPHAFNSLLLTNGAVLTHSPCTATNTHKLEVNVAGTIYVSSDSRIDVSGKGYLPGRTPCPTPPTGRPPATAAAATVGWEETRVA